MVEQKAPTTDRPSRSRSSHPWGQAWRTHGPPNANLDSARADQVNARDAKGFRDVAPRISRGYIWGEEPRQSLHGASLPTICDVD
jgi:hypothetical protein